MVLESYIRQNENKLSMSDYNDVYIIWNIYRIGTHRYNYLFLIGPIFFNFRPNKLIQNGCCILSKTVFCIHLFGYNINNNDPIKKHYYTVEFLFDRAFKWYMKHYNRTYLICSNFTPYKMVKPLFFYTPNIISTAFPK
jgi:hypothetical protein